MKSIIPLRRTFLFLLLILLAGFTVWEKTNEINEHLPYVEDEISMVAGEDVEENTSVIDYSDKGIMKASWYGPRFHGKLTANGEIYDQMALTAAHKSFRFGTLLRVTNPKNNKSVIVRINDRGPYIPGRHLDLSKGAAMQLGILEKGVANLKVEQISLKGVNFPVITLN